MAAEVEAAGETSEAEATSTAEAAVMAMAEVAMAIKEEAEVATVAVMEAAEKGAEEEAGEEETMSAISGKRAIVPEVTRVASVTLKNNHNTCSRDRARRSTRTTAAEEEDAVAAEAEGRAVATALPDEVSALRGGNLTPPRR